MRLLVVNVGSSSLKLSVLDNERLVGTEHLDMAGPTLEEGAIEDVVRAHPGLRAVGHRLVHGGADFVEPVVVDDAVRRRLSDLVALAPLHLPRSLAGLDVLRRLLPDVPAVACFDTAFHARMPAAARTYALPAAWSRRWPVLRRYGFHGLSHAWASRRAAQLVGRPLSSLRIVTCHLGAGASLCAVDGGRSVETTMGFTPLDGLVMATRSGALDPALVLWVQERAGVAPQELVEALEHQAGLRGLAGTEDMRQIVERADHDEAAGLALDVYLHHLRAGIAGMVAALGGIDVLVFTGGVGEGAAVVRCRAAEGLGFLGIALDETANAEAKPDAEVTAPGGAVRVLVVRAREDLEVAAQVRGLLGE